MSEVARHTRRLVLDVPGGQGMVARFGTATRRHNTDLLKIRPGERQAGQTRAVLRLQPSDTACC